MMRDVAIARPDARLEGALVEPMYLERHGRELMIGVVRDPVFGPAISFGLGGTMVEVIRDARWHCLVVTARPDPPHPGEHAL
jgi:acetyltransferase